MRWVVIALLVLAGNTPARAATCADYDAAASTVDKILSYDDESPLSDAYEALADAWLCTHPDVSAEDFVDWVHGVRTSQDGATTIPVANAPHGLLVVWRPDTLELGGRAVFYLRRNGTWRRADALELGARPEIIATLGATVLVGEYGAVSEINHLRVHALSVADATLVDEPLGDDDMLNPEVSVRRSSVRITYGRLPRSAHIEGFEPLDEYALTVRTTKRGTRSKVTSLTPALSFVDSYCGAPSDSRRSFVKGADLAGRLPDCGKLVVEGAERRPRRTYAVAIQADLVCTDKGGKTTGSKTEGSMIVRRVGGRLKIVGLEAAGCGRVRARTGDDPI